MQTAAPEDRLERRTDCSSIYEYKTNVSLDKPNATAVRIQGAIQYRAQRQHSHAASGASEKVSSCER
jgi:DNA/RNA endonuclease G (NUC1)